MAKKQQVRSLFDSIAYRYDLLNHLLSGGVDFYWRRRAVERLRNIGPKRIIDVATGTGDFAIAALRLHPDSVVGVDIAEEMLKVGRAKIRKKQLDSIITLQAGDAEDLPFNDGSFDAAIVAFGARNFEDLELGLTEMHRVLRPGGLIAVLEFSRPKLFPFKQLYFFYFLKILPVVGRLISGSDQAYTYLPDTVMRFPDGQDFLDILHRIGFHNTEEERLTFGIASVYTGAKWTATIQLSNPLNSPSIIPMSERLIRVGHSPDPDDAFMFYGLSSGKVKLEGIKIEHQLEDIQSLNERAMRAELEVTAISAHTFPYVANKYWVMKTGASMGEGYGPVIISRKFTSLEDLKGRTVGTPGPLTTATLLFKIFTDGIKNIDMPFDTIMESVDDGSVDAGLLIHEGQITYQALGYNKVLDFGELWDKETAGLPLPLGLDVVRKDLGKDLAQRLSAGLKESIAYGYAHQEESIPYALQWGRGIDDKLGEKFVKMYVSELTIDMGGRGKNALEVLFRKGYEKGLTPAVSEIELY